MEWVHCNARLMRKLKCHDYSEDYFEWDGVELEHEYERFAAEEPDNDSEHKKVNIGEDCSVDRVMHCLMPCELVTVRCY